MTPSPTSRREQERLAALERYRLLDTPADEGFDRLTRLARAIAASELAGVHLVDRSRAWPKSVAGGVRVPSPRSAVPCTRVVERREPVVVGDLSREPVPVTSGALAGMRFYAGVPVRTYEGHVLGTLWVADPHPRETLDDHLLANLWDVAGAVVDTMERHLDQALLEEAAQRMVASQHLARFRVEVLEQTIEDTPVQEVLRRVVAFARGRDRRRTAHLLEVRGDALHLAAGDPALLPSCLGPVASLDPEATPAALAVVQRAPVLVPRLDAEPRWPAFRASAARQGWAAVWAMPLRTHARTVGVLVVGRTEPGRPSSEELLTFAELAQLSTTAIVHHRTLADAERCFHLAPDLQVVTDLRGHILRLNPAWEQQLGHPPDAILGRPLLDLFHPDDAARTDEVCRHIARVDAPGVLRNRVRHRDGSFVDLSWTWSVDRDHGRVYASARPVRALAAQERSEPVQTGR